MKKRLFSLGMALLMLPALVQAQLAWQEGVHYEVVGEKAAAEANVREVFSFWCPHCFTFEPIVGQIKSNLPDGVSFKKAHVNFMGATTQEAQNDATLAMLAAKAMGDDQRFNTALFEAIHKQRTSIKNMDDIKKVYAAAGGDVAKLEKLTKSFGIRGQVKRNDQLTRGVSRVPAFIVNDKYKAIFTRDMTPDSFAQLINWLTTQK